MTPHEKMLLYLLQIITATGRQAIKDHLMGQVGGDDDTPRQLLNEINKFERVIGQLDRMSPDERARLWGAP